MYRPLIFLARRRVSPFFFFFFFIWGASTPSLLSYGRLSSRANQRFIRPLLLYTVSVLATGKPTAIRRGLFEMGFSVFLLVWQVWELMGRWELRIKEKRGGE